MNMVKAITNLVDVMNMMLEGDQGKEIVFPKQGYIDENNKQFA